MNRRLLMALLITLAAPVFAATTLHVSSAPPGAKIYLNGYYKGLTPLTVQFNKPPSQTTKYTITLVREGYANWKSGVTVCPGEQKSVTGTLVRAASAAPAPVRAGGSGLSGKIICVDPGHPSENGAGTRGKKITELHANWMVARKLKTLLLERGARVVMTKSSEGETVSNRKRAEIANAAGADLMVRLHCDCGGGPGLAIYYPDRQGTKFGVTGPSSGVIAGSRAAAKAMYPAIIAALAGRIRGKGIHGDSATFVGSKQGALTGSIFSRRPAITIEMATITNASDDSFMASEAGQSAMAAAIAKGIAAAL